MYRLPEAFDDGSGTVPLGRPLEGVEIHCVDRELRPVAWGEAGEICVSGSRIANGYLEDPALTAERFVTISHSADGETRLFRTRDLGRITADGVVEFLGRLDDRLKIRGFRIEPTEVEQALRAHPLIQQAAVLPRQTTHGSRELAAFLVVNGERPLGAHDVRSFLRQRLPEYMLPSSFFWIDHLPMTTHGKLDRSALRAMTSRPIDAGLVYQPAQTPTEQAVAEIWSEVLGRDRVGRQDNFLESGGHSLTAIDVASQLSAMFGVEVPIKVMFDTANAAELAKYIDENRELHKAPEAILPFSIIDRSLPIPLSYSQESLWIVDQLNPGNPVYNMHWVLELRGQLNIPLLRSSLKVIIARMNHCAHDLRCGPRDFRR
jgi:acyl carrier protein